MYVNSCNILCSAKKMTESTFVPKLQYYYNEIRERLNTDLYTMGYPITFRVKVDVILKTSKMMYSVWFTFISNNFRNLGQKTLKLYEAICWNICLMVVEITVSPISRFRR